MQYSHSRLFHFFALFLFVLCLTKATLSAPIKPAAGEKSGAKTPANASKNPTPANRPASPVAGTSSASASDPAEAGCGKQTTCEKCIAVKGSGGKVVCGFNQSGKCVGLSTAAASTLAKTAAECKALNTKANEQAGADAEFTAAAKSEFAKIKPHVFGTEKGLKNTSGRHLASSLLSVPANKNLQRTANASTGLSRFTNANGKVKTTWDDDTGKYTQAQVQSMCEDAIKSVLKLTNAKTLPKGTSITSVSVQSPLGMNLCISVQGNTSVFPGSTNPTSDAAGQRCTPDAEVSDDI
ncbi:hypothetical protein E1B28_002719 [Marasmius oreades]|uniref:Uncharacterized protein n=1 Tax=Marasmius oreades TaxID=181124 RepID=A0A9P7UND2_9AGAR|nr:uncharacterized protein E1B28_002719 [Marasmius oreades]KAG7086791.1 hypothetical protein E1B28_002719 [Marasmius oreades]